EVLWPDVSMVLGRRDKFAAIERARSVKELAGLPWIMQPKPQVDWTRSLPDDQAGYTVRDVHALRHLVLSGRGIGDLQVDMFTDAEKRRLAFARRVPSRYPASFIYAVFRDDIRDEARRCLDELIDELKRPTKRRR